MRERVPGWRGSPRRASCTSPTRRCVRSSTPSIGGSRARVVLSNAYGTAPLTIGAAQIALRDKDVGDPDGSGRPLTFSGQPTFTIPAGRGRLQRSGESDRAADGRRRHRSVSARHHQYAAAADDAQRRVSDQLRLGDRQSCRAAKLPVVATTQSWFVLSRVEVLAPDAAGGLVAFGDSITDGTRSTPDTNSRWPDQLVRRMLAQPTPLRSA